MVIKKNENAPAAAANGAKQQQQPQQQQQTTTTTKKQQQQPAPPAENAKGNGEATDAVASVGNGSGGEDAQNGGSAAAAAQGSEEADFAQLNEQLLLMGNALKAVTVLLKGLQKKTTKLSKIANKKQKRGGGGGEGKERQSNAFAKPNKVSDELCAFLKVPRGTEMSRTQVTKQLTQYVKDNKLQKEDDKRVINPDAALRAVLQVPPEEKVTYFNLQRLIKHHFIKDDATPAAPAAAAN